MWKRPRLYTKHSKEYRKMLNSSTELVLGDENMYCDSEGRPVIPHEAVAAMTGRDDLPVNLIMLLSRMNHSGSCRISPSYTPGTVGVRPQVSRAMGARRGFMPATREVLDTVGTHGALFVRFRRR